MAAMVVAGVAIGDSGPEAGRIGPQSRIQPSGRELHPYGKLTGLGNLPAGGALTPDGRFLWTLSAGRARNDVRIVAINPRGHGRARNAKVGRVIQVIPMPGLSGGMAFSPDGRTAYVSGVPDSSHTDQQVGQDV